MRDKARKEIRAIVDGSLDTALTAVYSDLKQDIKTSHEGALAAISTVQPAQVDLSQELADEITRKLRGPLVIPQEMSDWVREEAQYHDVQTFHRLGYSSSAADARWTLRPDGRIQLEILRFDGVRWWFGMFGPPE